MITIDNYEGYLMRYVDGELSESENTEMENFLTVHPELQEELAEISDPTLRVTAPLVTMPGKEQLMRPVRPAAKIFLRMAAAMALVLLAAGVVRTIMLSSKPSVTVASEESTATGSGDTLLPDSLYIKTILREPVLLAESETTSNHIRKFDRQHKKIRLEQMDRTALWPNPNDISRPELMATRAEYPEMPELPDVDDKVRLIAGRAILVECDNLIEILPEKEIVTPPGTQSGMVVESNHLVAEKRGGLLDNLFTAISNRFKQNNTNNDVICEL